MSLDGTWRAGSDNGCEAALVLDTVGGTYSRHRLCRADGNTNDESEEGSLMVLDGRHLTIEAQRTSCPLHPTVSGVLNYRVSGSALTIYFPGQTETYSRQPAALAEPVRSGCYEQTGFIPYAIQNL